MSAYRRRLLHCCRITQQFQALFHELTSTGFVDDKSNLISFRLDRKHAQLGRLRNRNNFGAQNFNCLGLLLLPEHR